MVRVRRGSEVRIAVENHLPEGTTLHWRGIRLPNPMDGVPGVTQPAIAPGDRFMYQFRPAVAGTFFYHSHAGLQLDTGIQGPLVVEDPSERAEYDEEAFLQLDDWLDGLDGLTPQTELAQLKARAAGKTMMMDRGCRVGKRVRLRIVNAGSDTAFAFFVEGQTMTVTHADSVPVRPVRTEGLVMGPGERYDAIVEVPEGVTRLTAAPMDKKGVAMAVLRSTGAKVRGGLERDPYSVPVQVLPYHELRSLEGPRLHDTPRPIELELGKVEGEYKWLIQGQSYPEAEPVPVGVGEHVRFVIKEATGMLHPMHLHGHFFRLGGPNGPVKDTFLPPPMQVSTIDWVRENPGRWAFHCHNEYHADTGMLRVVSVE